MNKRKCFSKVVCCFVLLMSLNGCYRNTQNEWIGEGSRTIEKGKIVMLYCKFCKKYLNLDEARNIDLVDNGTAKFVCNTCNYRTESKMFYSLQDKEEREWS